MLLAHSENKLIPPTKGSNAKCPLCSSKVVAKCGEINIDHWAHDRNEGCDSWSEPETYWHKSWKESFPTEFREVVIEKNGKRHFADLFTNEKIVIELQNSSISSEIIREREEFYGQRLLWVINGGKFRNNIKLHENEKITQILNKKYPDRWFGGIYLSDEDINEYLSTSDEFTFSWRYPIRSWINSKRPVFLDINENFMLWFKRGIGTDYGRFKVYHKHRFFRKYNGDYETYCKLNNDERLLDYKKFVKIIYRTCWDFNKELKTYNFPPYLSLKVYDNFTKKTCLHKARWNELLIPNGNSKGLFFLFCANLKDPDITGVYASLADRESISKTILKIIQREEKNSEYHLRAFWNVEYMASIPLNKLDVEGMGHALLNFYITNLTNCLIDHDKMEIIGENR